MAFLQKSFPMALSQEERKPLTSGGHRRYERLGRRPRRHAQGGQACGLAQQQQRPPAARQPLAPALPPPRRQLTCPWGTLTAAPTKATTNPSSHSARRCSTSLATRLRASRLRTVSPLLRPSSPPPPPPLNSASPITLPRTRPLKQMGATTTTRTLLARTTRTASFDGLAAPGYSGERRGRRHRLYSTTIKGRRLPPSTPAGGAVTLRGAAERAGDAAAAANNSSNTAGAAFAICSKRTTQRAAGAPPTATAPFTRRWAVVARAGVPAPDRGAVLSVVKMLSILSTKQPTRTKRKNMRMKRMEMLALWAPRKEGSGKR